MSGKPTTPEEWQALSNVERAYRIASGAEVDIRALATLAKSLDGLSHDGQWGRAADGLESMLFLLSFGFPVPAEELGTFRLQRLDAPGGLWMSLDGRPV